MKRQIIITSLALLCALLSCTDRRTESGEFNINTVWVLRHVEFPSGTEQDFALNGEGTSCLIYDRENRICVCNISTTPTGLLVQPMGTATVTLIDKGGGEWLYLEDNDPHPLQVSDSAITIQRMGILYTYSRADDIYSEWGDDLHDIFAVAPVSTEPANVKNYVLSAHERQQANYIQWLIATVTIIVILFVAYYIVGRRRRQQLQLQLRQIREVQENRPPSVRQAAKSVEETFFASDEYFMLQRRMATGQLIKDEEWQQVEHSLMTVYPGFGSQLRGLYAMSELEYQVCMLVKLRIAPTDIAAVLARDVSTISTVRSRLYKKVFGRKGGAREWDEFILSISA